MKLSAVLAKAVTIVAVVGGGYLLYRNLSRYSFADLVQSIYAIPLSDGLMSFGFVVLSYLALAAFDGSALVYLKRRIAPPRILLASFTALSIGHNVGISLLSSAAVRYRYYTRWGLTAAEVGQLVVFCGFTVALGIATLAGITMIIPLGNREIQGLGGAEVVTIVGAAILLFPVAYVIGARYLPRHFRIRNCDVRVPDWRVALAQVVIGTVNFTFVAASLYFLLRHSADIHFIDVARGYAIANMLAIISHVPGGLGVLEAGLLYALPGEVPFGVLIAFRILYFFIPLATGLPLFLLTEAFHFGGRSKRQRRVEKCDDASRHMRRNSEPDQTPSR